MRKQDKSYRFRLPNALFEAAIQKAECEDLTLAQALRRFLRAWVAGEIETPAHTELLEGEKQSKSK